MNALRLSLVRQRQPLSHPVAGERNLVLFTRCGTVQICESSLMAAEGAGGCRNACDHTGSSTPSTENAQPRTFERGFSRRVMDNLVRSSVAAVSYPDWLGTTAHQSLLFPAGLLPNPAHNIQPTFFSFNHRDFENHERCYLSYTNGCKRRQRRGEQDVGPMRNIRFKKGRAGRAVGALEGEMEDGWQRQCR